MVVQINAYRKQFYETLEALARSGETQVAGGDNEARASLPAVHSMDPERRKSLGRYLTAAETCKFGQFIASRRQIAAEGASGSRISGRVKGREPGA